MIDDDEEIRKESSTNRISPSTVYEQIAEYLLMMGQKMTSYHDKRMKQNNPISKEELDNTWKEIDEQLQLIQDWGKNNNR